MRSLQNDRPDNDQVSSFIRVFWFVGYINMFYVLFFLIFCYNIYFHHTSSKPHIAHVMNEIERKHNTNNISHEINEIDK